MTFTAYNFFFEETTIDVNAKCCDSEEIISQRFHCGSSCKGTEQTARGSEALQCVNPEPLDSIQPRRRSASRETCRPFLCGDRVVLCRVLEWLRALLTVCDDKTPALSAARRVEPLN